MEKRIAKTASIRELFLFDGLDDDTVQKACEEAAVTYHTYRTGEDICTPDTYEAALYFLCRGTANVYRRKSEHMVLLNTLTAGAPFGVTTLFAGNAPPTHTVACGTVKVARIGATQMESLLLRYPQMAMNYVRFLSGRIAFLNDRIDCFSTPTVEGRVAKFLLAHAGQCGELRTPLNRKQIASSLDIGRASLYRILDEFERIGAVGKEENQIVVRDPAYLERLAHS